jgi:hypothetical protein
MWVPGKWVAIDEQTLGFQGALGMKLQISYKSRGVGFNAMLSAMQDIPIRFIFATNLLQMLESNTKIWSCPPLIDVFCLLVSCLPNQWRQIYMENLFNSKKLYKALYKTEALVYGVAHTNGQGIPPWIIQKEEKNINCAEQLRCTMMAARLFIMPHAPERVQCKARAHSI